MFTLNKLLKSALLTITTLCLVFAATSVKAESNAYIYPIDYHIGWGTGNDGSSWYWVPYSVPTALDLYSRDLATGNVQAVSFSTPLQMGKLYILNVAFPIGYIPMHLNQPQYFAKLEHWKFSSPAGWGPTGNLPCPPFTDTYEFLAAGGYGQAPWPTGHSRVFAAQYRFSFTGNPAAPTVYAVLYWTSWANPINCPYNTSELMASLPSVWQ